MRGACRRVRLEEALRGVNGSSNMWSIARAPWSWPRRRISVAGGIRRLIAALELAVEVRRERRMLLSLDDRILKDIGLSRGEAWAEGCRSLWEIPRDRLWL
jgi:uncharacterized protein YjiS (DUF1127 family)